MAGAATLSITTLRIMTVNITTPRIMTVNVTTLNLKGNSAECDLMQQSDDI